jgi:hypothetical protein
MGGKSSPPPPDYRGAAQEQAQASVEQTNMQNYANRPTQNTPFGNQTWQTNAVIDPATGQRVTQWTQNTTLAPQAQSALDSQMALQQGRSDLAQGFMGRVENSYQNPFDWQNLPNRVDPNAPPELQRGLNTQGLQAIPQYDMNARNQIADSLMERMQPTHDRQMQGMSAQLANQGFQVGSEAYNRALGDLTNAQSRERFNALDMAGNEAQRMYSMGLGARQQGFQEALQGGQFANQAAGQSFNFGGQYADQMARMRQQGIAEQQLQRAMPLNEMNALLTGQQVGMPNMPSFNPAQRAETPQLLQAANMGYQAQLDQSNASNAAFGNLLGAGAQLGSAYFGGPFRF